MILLYNSALPADYLLDSVILQQNCLVFAENPISGRDVEEQGDPCTENG
jgi:hypothetical protein